jgi:hypothetical protein
MVASNAHTAIDGEDMTSRRQNIAFELSHFRVNFRHCAGQRSCWQAEAVGRGDHDQVGRNNEVPLSQSLAIV